MSKSKISVFEILIAIYYTWFFMPIVNAYFSGEVFKYLFFGMFALGVLGMVVIKNRAWQVPFNHLTIAVLAYFIVMLFMYLCNLGDARDHIRVSFTFWGTALVYFYSLNNEERIRMGKFFLLLFIVTCITSSIGVVLDNNAARTITHAAADDNLQYAYYMKNIGSIYLFQCMVMAMPLVVALAKEKRDKIFSAIIIVTTALVLINASFTIALLVFFVGISLSVLFLKSKSYTDLFIKICLVCLLLILVSAGKDILSWFASVIDNDSIKSRILELVDLIYEGAGTEGDVDLRLNLYMTSIKTFLRNPLGVGPWYSYVIYSNGIGYHSQILDDLARYGLFALAFYIMFFIGYYRLLKSEWQGIVDTKTAAITVALYAVFLILNLGFRSGIESVVMLFLVPIVPKIVAGWKEKRKKFFGHLERQDI